MVKLLASSGHVCSILHETLSQTIHGIDCGQSDSCVEVEEEAVSIILVYRPEHEEESSSSRWGEDPHRSLIGSYPFSCVNDSRMLLEELEHRLI